MCTWNLNCQMVLCVDICVQVPQTFIEVLLGKNKDDRCVKNLHNEGALATNLYWKYPDNGVNVLTPVILIIFDSEKWTDHLQ